MWVRGLKHRMLRDTLTAVVAPYVGAWIETLGIIEKNLNNSSHPMWVRGLKQRNY